MHVSAYSIQPTANDCLCRNSRETSKLCIKSRNSGSINIFVHAAGNHGSQWQKAIVCLPIGMYGLAFVGTIGVHGQSDIAIDNVDLSYDRTVCYDTEVTSAVSGMCC